jgi:hypothetical protein
MLFSLFDPVPRRAPHAADASSPTTTILIPRLIVACGAGDFIHHLRNVVNASTKPLPCKAAELVDRAPNALKRNRRGTVD